jgi:hypothetical protein
MTDIITTKPLTETEALFQDLNKPSLHALSYALRHPDTWPTEFHWNYSNCATCAMGLAHLLWKKSVEPAYNATGVTIMARAFSMPYTEAQDIFMRGRGAPRTCYIGKRDYKRLTPERVADAIDAYLKTAE